MKKRNVFLVVGMMLLIVINGIAEIKSVDAVGESQITWKWNWGKFHGGNAKISEIGIKKNGIEYPLITGCSLKFVSSGCKDKTIVPENVLQYDTITDMINNNGDWSNSHFYVKHNYSPYYIGTDTCTGQVSVHAEGYRGLNTSYGNVTQLYSKDTSCTTHPDLIIQYAIIGDPCIPTLDCTNHIGQCGKKLFDGCTNTLDCTTYSGQCGERECVEILTEVCEVDTNGLVSHWDFEDDVNDSVGGNDGSVVGGVNIVSDGERGNVAEFDGTGYINLGSDTSLEVDFPLTLEGWVYITDDATYNTIVNTDDYAGGSKYSGAILAVVPRDSGAISNKVLFAFGDGGGWTSNDRKTEISNTVIENNKWYHIVGVIENKDNMRIYINGELDNSNWDRLSTAINLVNRGSGWNGYIGRMGSSYFNGKLDDVKVWDRALSGGEVLEEYGVCESEWICSGCTSSDDCTFPEVCEVSTGSCVDCYLNGIISEGCLAPTPVCDINNPQGNTCVECVVDADCDDSISSTIDTCNLTTNVCESIETSKSYWANMNGVEITNADIGDSVLLVYDKVSSVYDFEIYEDDFTENNAWFDDDIKIGDDAISSVLIGDKAIARWTITQEDFEKGNSLEDFEFTSNDDEEFYFKVNNLKSDLLLVAKDSATREDANTKPTTQILTPVPPLNLPDDIEKNLTGVDIGFTQWSLDDDDALKLTWNFGDGNVSVFDNCFRFNREFVCDSGNGNVIHNYIKSGTKNIVLKVEEVAREQYAVNYSMILIYGDEMNIFPLITKPLKGFVSEKRRVKIDGSDSFIAYCNSVEGECETKSLLNDWYTGLDNCYGVVGGVETKYCFDFPKVEGETLNKYNLYFEWTFDAGTDVESKRIGYWNGNYSEAVDSYKILGSGKHEINLILGHNVLEI